jgi:hypothetical protein
MTRALDDRTSTCHTCTYFSEDSPDGTVPNTGHCGWFSLPAYVWKYIGKDKAPLNTMLKATDGIDCWLHTKRSESDVGTSP